MRERELAHSESEMYALSVVWHPVYEKRIS